MSKYLLILAIVAVVYAATRGPRKMPTHTAQGKKPGLPAPQNMVACARCGVHLPESDALHEGQHFFCCAAHRNQGPA